MTINSPDTQLRVGAVVVTYHPDPTSFPRIIGLLDVVQELVIVDNDSSPPVKSLLGNLSCKNNIHIICNDSNIGIAAALNQGCNYLLDHGYEYAILLDQDSIVTDGMVQTLATTASQNPSAAIIAPAIAPIGIDADCISHKLRFLVRSNSILFRKSKLISDIMEVAMVITSGGLYSLHCWRSVGGFWEELFIEGVDNEYCLRVHDAGFTVCVNTNATLRQQYGAQKLCRFFGRDFFPTFHSPLRHYYVARNRIHIWRRHWRHNLFYISWDILSFLNTLFLILIAEDRKDEKFRSILKGTLDGMLSKFGKKVEG